MEYDAAAARRKHFEPPRADKPPNDPSLPYLQQLNKGLEPLDAKIRSVVAGLGRSVVPGNQYPLSKLDEWASRAVGALTAPNNPMGNRDQPPQFAWPPKAPEEIYKYNREIRKKEPEAEKAGSVVGDILRDYGIMRGVGKAVPAGNIMRSNTAGGQVGQSVPTSFIGATIKEINDAEDAAYDRGENWNAYEGAKNILRNTAASMTAGAIGGMGVRRFLGAGGGLLKNKELLPDAKSDIRAANEQNKNLPVNPNLHFGELAQQAGQTEVAAKANRVMRDAQGITLTDRPSWVRSDPEWQGLVQKYGDPPVIPIAMADRLKERAQPGGFNEATRDLDNRLTLAQDRLNRGTAGTPPVAANPNATPPTPAVPGVPPLNLPLTGITPPGVNPLRERQHQLAQMEGRAATPPIPGNQIPSHSMNIWDRTTKDMPLQQQLEIQALIASVAPQRGYNNIAVPGAITQRADVMRDRGAYQSARDAISDAFPMSVAPPPTMNVSAPILAAATGKAPLAQVGFSFDRSKAATKPAPGMVNDPLTFMDEIGRASPGQSLGNAVGQSFGREVGSPFIQTWIGLEDERRKRELAR